MLDGYKATTLKECFSYRVHDSASHVTNGMLFQQAFSQYTEFIISLLDGNDAVREVANRYGSVFLLYYCESLSHRLLKTPIDKRTIKVADFISKCTLYAEKLIPGQSFKPLDKFRIRIASQLDQSAVSRYFFNLTRRVVS